MRLVEPDIDVPDHMSMVYLKSDDEKLMYQFEHNTMFESLLIAERIPVEGEGNCHIYTSLDMD